jgi:type IV secretory pathway TrbD component
VLSPSTETHPIHAALIRPVLFAGAIPELLIIEVATVFALLFVVGLHIATVLMAAVYAFGIHALAVWITAHDPQMLATYLRSLATKDFYVPHATVLAAVPAVRPAIPPR